VLTEFDVKRSGSRAGRWRRRTAHRRPDEIPSGAEGLRAARVGRTANR
jgi:hypothetical protein